MTGPNEIAELSRPGAGVSHRLPLIAEAMAIPDAPRRRPASASSASNETAITHPVNPPGSTADDAALARWAQEAPLPMQWLARDARVIWANAALLALVGRPRASYRNARETFDDPEQLDHVLRHLSDARTAWDGAVRLRRPDGQSRDAWMTAHAASTASGTLQARCVLWDVTERRRADEVHQFLADASTCLASSLDYQTTLSTLARLVVPRMADWCVIDVAEKDHRLQRLAVAHVDPAKVAMAQELERRYPPDPSAARGPAHVMRTGRSDMAEHISDTLLVAGARDAEHLRILRTLGLTSYLCVPLAARGRILGVMTFVAGESGRRYTAHDLAVAEDLARRAAMAVDNARLFHRAQEEVAERQMAEQRFRAVFDHALEAMVLADDRMQYLDANAAACELFGLPREQLLGCHVPDLTAPESRDQVALAWQAFLRQGELTGTFPLRRPNGTTREVEFGAKANVLPGQHLSVLRDVTERRRMEQALRTSEEQYRLLFESNPHPMWVFDRETLRFLAVNDAAVRHYGYGREEFLAMSITDIRPAEDVPALLADVQDQAESGPVSVGVLRHRKKDGTLVDVDVTRSSIVFQGRPARLVLAADVTQRRRALEEKDVLLKEIHHRVKNNMQVILSLLELQALHAHDPDTAAVLSESQHRIKSMALIHEVLYQTEHLASIAMRPYVERLMTHLVTAYGVSPERVRPVIDVREVYLNLDTAIPCGLLINELVSNAFKHAFPEDRRGEVGVRLEADGPGTWQLRVYDTGVGLPPGAEQAPGRLGLQLVQALVEQLGGRLDVNREDGTSFSMHVRELQGQRGAMSLSKAAGADQPSGGIFA
jgi:PAS domain S-box-containing protein